jgi:holo-[acyl-carrier protein] synthase
MTMMKILKTLTSMIYGIGTDIVETRRVQQTIASYGERFLAKVFTENERAYCAAKAEPARSASFAARFAAKEAFSKALGTGIGEHAAWTEVEVVALANGKPAIVLHKRLVEQCARQFGAHRIHLTLAHTHDYATATVLIEVLGAASDAVISDAVATDA